MAGGAVLTDHNHLGLALLAVGLALIAITMVLA